MATSASALSALAERLELLEAAFGPTQAGASVKESVNKLLIDLARLEKTSPALQELLSKSQEIESRLLEAPSESKLLSAASKRQILLAKEDELRETARQLEYVKASESFLNTPAFEEVAKLAIQVQPIAAAHAGQSAQAEAADARLLSLLGTYNDLVYLLSEKFIYYDSLLTRLEQKVEGLEKSGATK